MIEHDRTGPVEMLTWTFSRIMMWGPAFIVGIILYEVIMRYFFAAATLWVNEMSLWAGGCIFLSAGLYSMQQRSHIRIFILYDIAPLWMKRTFDVAANVCLSIFCLGVIFGSYDKTEAPFVTWELFGSAFNPPIPATMKPLILVVMLILTLQALSNLIRDWPPHSNVRKIFDVIATAIITGIAGFGLYKMFVDTPDVFEVPTKWQAAIAIMLIATIVITLYGLVKDFDRIPKPFSEIDETKEEVDAIKQTLKQPDEVLTGNPPKK